MPEKKMTVDDLTIEEFFQKINENERNTFLIPNYQRPYSWEEKHCETLWDDIVSICEKMDEEDEDENNEETYFLGSIVYFKEKENPEEKNKWQIIDGQQRITTLSLLIRALFDIVKPKVEPKKENKIDLQINDKETLAFAKRFEKCLWVYNKDEGEVDYSKQLLESKVAADDQQKILKEILSFNLEKNSEKEKEEKSKKKEKETSKYLENYKFFKKQIKGTQTYSWKNFFKAILEKMSVLSIECKSQDSALRIFTTLNDRGMSLKDSDIFKGIIFSNCKTEKEKDAFADDWKELNQSLLIEKGKKKEAIFDVDFLFTQYTHVIRAEKQNKGSEIAVRKFYTKENKELLDKENFKETFENIKELRDLWLNIYDLTQTNPNVKTKGTKKEFSLEVRQRFDILFHYPNEFWKHMTSAFYFWCKRENINFYDDSHLLSFLEKMIAVFFMRFLETPTVNNIKSPVFNAYVTLYANNKENELFNGIQCTLPKDIKNTGKLLPALLALNMYLKYPKQKIIDDRQIEHILPKKWKACNYEGWNDEKANEYLESIGNKMFLEKLTNIEAGNVYFGRKIESYEKSEYREAKKISKQKKRQGKKTGKTAWLPEDVDKREDEIFKEITSFFKKYL